MARMSTVAMALAAALGAGGGSHALAGDVPCSVKLSGDVSTSFSCSAAAASKAGAWDLALTGSGANGAALISNVKFGSAPAVGKYTLAQATSGGLSVIVESGAEYAAAGAKGGFTLTLTSVTALVTNNGSTVYAIHGSFAATLPKAGGGGSISASGTF